MPWKYSKGLESKPVSEPAMPQSDRIKRFLAEVEQQAQIGRTLYGADVDLRTCPVCYACYPRNQHDQHMKDHGYEIIGQ